MVREQQDFDETFLIKMANTGFGVISPTGVIFPCNQYDHFETLKQFNDFKKYFDRFSNFEKIEADEYTSVLSCGDQSAGNDFEKYMSTIRNDFRQAVLNLAYSKGYGRIGFIRKNKSTNTFHVVKVELEAYETEHLRKIRKVTNDLSEMYNADFILTIQKPNKKENRFIF